MHLTSQHQSLLKALARGGRAICPVLVACACLFRGTAATPGAVERAEWKNLESRQQARAELVGGDLYHNCAVLSDKLTQRDDFPSTHGKLISIADLIGRWHPGERPLALVTDDPWGRPYLFWSSGESFAIVCTGRDGKQNAAYEQRLAGSSTEMDELRRAFRCGSTDPMDQGDDVVYFPFEKCE